MYLLIYPFDSRPIENYQLVDMSHLDEVIWFEEKVVRNSISFCCFKKKSAMVYSLN